MKSRFTIGLDLGGSKIAGCLCSADGRVVAKKKIPTFSTGRSSSSVIASLSTLVCDLELKARMRRGKIPVGLASAGPLDVERGLLINPVPFAGWGRVQIVERLAKKISRKVHFQNDAMAAAIGEGWIGKAKGLQTYVVITVGTGIGTGLIINGSPCQTRGRGSEWGHCIVPDESSGQSDSVENYASATALINRARKMGFKGEDTFALVDHVKRFPKSKYLKVFDDGSVALAQLCFSLSIGTGVQKIIFAGGMSKEKELFLDKTISNYRKLIRPKMKIFEAPIVTSSLGDYCGAIGAARLPYR